MLKLTSYETTKTEELGTYIGKLLNSGDIVCLSGNLGVGKTTFVKGLAKGLNIEEHLTSPTFTIVNEYDGRIKLYHFDVYRINNPDELYWIGFEEYIYGDAVCVIEWAELIADTLPKEKIWIEINKNIDISNEYREIIINSFGSRYDNFIGKLTEDWGTTDENACD